MDEDEDQLARKASEKEADRLRKSEPLPKIGEAEFLAWRSPRKVEANPTPLDSPLWHWLVRTRFSAYHANGRYSGPSGPGVGPMWCFDRFGKSQTALADGRVIHIGGEHEDFYDPDFHIYNDVTVIDAEGTVAIYGYPEQDFPPTDFHSATLVGDAIYVIGRLGYPETRTLDATPVYRLLLGSMQMEAVATHGDAPGWINRHEAALEEDGRTIVISGGELWLGAERTMREQLDSWALDTRSGEWRRLTRREWQHWVMLRVDRKPNRLWDTRQELWNREHAHHGFKSYWRHAEEPDFSALDQLYRIGNGPAPTEGDGSGQYSVVIDGVKVRFHEDTFHIEAIVEGQLAAKRLAELQRATLALLERIDGAAYEIENA
jgi:hypothetical protein